MTVHVFKFTPTGGSQINLNDRTNTFLGKDFKLGAKATAFKEVRNFAGGIRQNDKHHPLVKMELPVIVVGTSGSPAVDLKTRVTAIQAACLLGGVLEFKGPGEATSTYFTIGCSDAPDPVHDYLYIRDHTAKLVLALWRAP